MAKIEKFDRPTLTKFRKDFSDAVKELEKNYGVKLDIGNISFNSEQFTSKLTTTIVREGEDPEKAKAMKEIKTYGFRYNITENDYGKVFTANGKVFTFVGLKPKSPKFPVLGKDSNGVT
jgi:hypothetical protein